MDPTDPTDPTDPIDPHAARVRVPPLDRGPVVSGARQGNWALVFLRGVLAIVFALLAFVWPAATMASLVLLFSAYMLVDGACAIVSGVRAARSHERWGWFALEGFADLIAAAVAFLWPSITIFAFVLVAAAWALVSGVLMLVAAYRVGAQRGRAWLLLAGIVSLAWGALLIVAPVAGAIAMLWWLGAYAFAFGVALLVAAARLRRVAHETALTHTDLHGAV